jgi:hypothetical protein
MKSTLSHFLCSMAALASLAASACCAQPAPGGGGEPPPRRPPPEALEACKSLAAGKACSFASPRGGTVQGSCWAPEGKPLACRPKDAPPPAEGGKPARP